MKINGFAVLCLLFIPIALSGKDEYGHSLTKLWAEYYSARKADLPQKEISALGAIKSKAASSRLDWDFYDAAEKYAGAVSRRNWKDRQKALDAFDNEVEKYNSAVMTFYHRRHSASLDDLSVFVLKHRRELEGSLNREFHSADPYISGNVAAPVIAENLRNDYEYVLWSLFLRDNRRFHDLMIPVFDGRYPLDAVAEYQEIVSSGSEDGILRKSLEDFSARYAGRAVSLLSRQELLSLRFYALDADRKSTEREFRELDADCVRFLSDREMFLVKEKVLADCCRKVDGIRKTLRSEDSDITVRNDSVFVCLKNQASAEVKVTGGSKTVFSRRLDNPFKSFYKVDTLVCLLPALDDGVYQVNGKEYIRRSISLAVQKNASGYGIYAADYMSGEPLKKVDVFLVQQSGKVLASAAGFGLGDVFTALPEIFQSAKEDFRQIYVSTKDTDGRYRCSGKVYLPSEVAVADAGRETLSAIVISDRGAFNPGDTVHFKAVAYFQGDRIRPASGESLVVELLDATGRIVARKEGVTSDYGSFDGAFPLERGSRNGMYRLNLSDGAGRILASGSIRVDDFILPSFSLAWNGDNRIFFPGDEVEMEGVIKSNSGHNLSSAAISCKVSSYGEDVPCEVTRGEDGSFSVRFTADPGREYSYYSVVVKVVDTTGETLEFTKSFPVSGRPSLRIVVQNTVESECSLAGASVITSDKLSFTFDCGAHPEKKVEWALRKGSETISEGSAEPGNAVELSLAGMPSGMYVLEGRYKKTVQVARIIKLSEEDDAADIPADWFACLLPGEDMTVKVASAQSPLWVVAELYGSDDRLLESRGFKVDSLLTTLRFPYRKDYPDLISLKLLCFRNKTHYEASFVKERERRKDTLPLEFGFFSEKLLPATEYEFVLHTEPEVECAAAIYDRSLETVARNDWEVLHHYGVPQVMSVFRQVEDGVNGTFFPVMYKTMANGVARLSADGAVPEEVYERRDFSPALFWAPNLRSDAEGNVRLRFRTGDRLSAFRVQVFAHDRKMRSAVLRRDMTVSLPVEISVAPPVCLYEGDRYVLRVNVSNSLSIETGGVVGIECPGMKTKERITLPPGGAGSVSFPVERILPGELAIKVKFISDNPEYGSDAIEIRIPVRKAETEIRESHSAVISPDADVRNVTDSLRSCFVNADGKTALVREVLISDMLRDALGEKSRPVSEDVLSLSSSLYAGILSSSLGMKGFTATERRELIEKIRACVNGDGGFCWFPGMKSNASVTAVVLQRLAALGNKGLRITELENLCPGAVSFLDREYFRKALSLEQYCLVRSLYPSVPFEKNSFPSKEYNAFKKDVKSFLLPSDGRGLEGLVLKKARRVSILEALTGSVGGLRLAGKWGLSSREKMLRSLAADRASLVEYAVPHSAGGFYFPNAVLPWRGLQESELYAHSLLCGLVGNEKVAEGIRLWMMIQKESQQWWNDPAYVDALAAVMDGSESTLRTKVLALDATARRRFDEVAASSNGLSVRRRYLLDGKEIAEGTILHVGDKVVGEYRCWSAENRSFVRLSVPRPAGLRPVNQRSGCYGWWLNVLPDRTEYWFDSYPEETSVFREEFFVMQEGEFHSGIPEIESLYAPHYRANDTNIFLKFGACNF